MSGGPKKCAMCKKPIPVSWTYCELCRRELAVENRHEAHEELSSRWEAEEARRDQRKR